MKDLHLEYADRKAVLECIAYLQCFPLSLRSAGCGGWRRNITVYYSDSEVRTVMNRYLGMDEGSIERTSFHHEKIAINKSKKITVCLLFCRIYEPILILLVILGWKLSRYCSLYQLVV